MQPFFESISKQGANLMLSWQGFGPARLQRANRLMNPNWQDVLDAAGANAATLPMGGGQELFRLMRP